VPLEVSDVGPWQVGLSGGFTRRGNSALLLGDPAHALGSLDAVEEVYREAGRPPILRTGTDRSPAPPPPELVDELDRRGYRTVSTTRVLARPVAGAAPPADGVRVTAADAPDDAWLSGWLGTKAATTAVDVDLARRLLTGSPAVYLTAADAGGVVGTIRAARAEPWVGLSCLAVDPSARRRGLGRRLTAAAIAAQPGVARAFLQVEVRNVAALALYRDLGFVEVDEYTYAER
jgi:GNAT superfamily N-acetyltransferase